MPTNTAQPPPLLYFIAKDAASVGLGTGLAGVAVGGMSGLFKSARPGLFALASGIQCFSLGFTYTATRLAAVESLSLLQKKPVGDLSTNDRRIASTVAGASAGGVTATIFRGPANVLPGVMVWGLLGLGGQIAVDAAWSRLEAKSTAPKGPSLLDRITSSSWSPMKKLSDEEYQHMLKERLLRVEAEMAVIDEEITKLSS